MNVTNSQKILARVRESIGIEIGMRASDCTVTVRAVVAPSVSSYRVALILAAIVHDIAIEGRAARPHVDSSTNMVVIEACNVVDAQAVRDTLGKRGDLTTLVAQALIAIGAVS